MPLGFRSRLAIVLLTLAVAYAALTSGGDAPLDANITLLIVGLVQLGRYVSRGDAPFLTRLMVEATEAKTKGAAAARKSE